MPGGRPRNLAWFNHSCLLPRLLIPVESAMGETRVAASPDTVKKFLSLGSKVAIERGAGLAAGFVDAAYGNVGAELVTPGDEQFWGQTDLLLCVHAPSEISLQKLRPGATIVGLLAPYSNSALAAALKSAPR